jgi:phage terminase small subunit
VARKLDARQAAFCRYYAVDHKTATEAAKLAGYSPHYANSQAAQLLRKSKISDEVARLKERAEQAALEEYAVTRSDVRRGLHHEAQNAETPAARVRAWELLGKDIGMFTDKHEVTLRKDPGAMTDEELEQALQHAGLR